MVLERREPLVITRPYYLESSDCGYCHCKPKAVSPAKKTYPAEANIPPAPTHVTIGCKVEQMSCADYDDFINLGFRRLGDFLYKGDMLRGCCRMYTIRTQLAQMALSKEHRQVVNRFKRAIGEKPGGKAGHVPNARFSLASLIEAEQQSTRFCTRFEPATFSEEKFALYKRYQTVVHHDKPEKVTKALFTDFLCKSPFLDHEAEGHAAQWRELNTWVASWRAGKAAHVTRLGPTHECYYLDGKLIAVSVLDFLPSGVSSVYLIWDPDHAHLSLGTLLGVREVQMCHELNLGYYYLGYYMEDCAKMRYKKKFGGELLDVCNETFVPLEKVRPMMADDGFWAITEDGHEEDESSEESEVESGEESEESEESGEESEVESGNESAGSGEESEVESGNESEDEGGKESEVDSICHINKQSENANTKDGRIQDNKSGEDTAPTQQRQDCKTGCGKICCGKSKPGPEDTTESELDEGEHELTLSGLPGAWRHNIVDFSQQIYSNKETYKTAEIAEKVLGSHLGCSASELPRVLPGAIPLVQLVSWIEENALDLGLPVTVYSTRTGRLHECDLGELPPTEKNHVIDFLRLFGLERTQTAIILV